MYMLEHLRGSSLRLVREAAKLWDGLGQMQPGMDELQKLLAIEQEVHDGAMYTWEAHDDAYLTLEVPYHGVLYARKLVFDHDLTFLNPIEQTMAAMRIYTRITR
jgi:hypothetical protein